jgi:hypothetical protein
MRQLVLLGLRAEAQLVDVVDDLAQVVAALDLVLDFTEDFADFVFDSVRPAGFLLEAVKIRKELPIDEVAKVIASLCLVVVDLTVLGLGRCPFLPAVRLSRRKVYFFRSRAASSTLSYSSASRYFRKRSQVCSV